MLRIGLDVGSTTLKSVVLSESGEILFCQYERHYSMIWQKVIEMLKKIQKRFGKEKEMILSISGSAGMGLAEVLNIEFIQEVYATRAAVMERLPESDVVIELGGEDAKILFLTNGLEVCMNGSCAGGTGAFIDQMAALLKVEPEALNNLAAHASKTYDIASRCGVFAKSDIQPLLNQGATKEDVAASIFQAVVNQTIAGLAHGRSIEGNIVYLGGPNTFFEQLRKTFDKTLHLEGVCPEYSLYFVAYGAALLSGRFPMDIDEVIIKLKNLPAIDTYKATEALFENEAEFEEFLKHHPKRDANITNSSNEEINCCIGIDAGSTTLKGVVIDQDGKIIFSRYQSNSGSPVGVVKDFLLEFYEHFPNANVQGAATTGYGEEIIKQAFKCDGSLVETMAHYKAAATFDPDVDFIIDIGGQDIKCFQIRNQAIDNIFLNEACSSGCGSFLQTFAQALGYEMEDFSKKGLFAPKPVDLGSRCTVFMNSSVKQAQKDGATIENISAGLSISVVKNALYKVIRKKENETLGQHIIVQGGTFLNDAVLRAFEKEIKQDVIRPDISGLMGAYGSALYALDLNLEKSTLLNAEDLEKFEHKVVSTSCKGCTNHCRLTINTFHDGSRYVAGNQCSFALGKKKNDSTNNLYAYKRELLSQFESKKGKYETLGLPLGLNLLELLPFWHTILSELGFGIELSGLSSKKLYAKGQTSIVSDTVCFPAKLMHGHIQELLEKKVDSIFYPCLTYNIDEGHSDNHYNCPVVAYYPEVIKAAIDMDIPFVYPYLGIHRKKDFKKHLRQALNDAYHHDFTAAKISDAVDKGYETYYKNMDMISLKAEQILKNSVLEKRPVIILAGRPYHIDEQICHGIDEMITSLGASVISEDGLRRHYKDVDVDVLNQWTYHARMFNAAEFICKHPEMDINLVQLVSFGCGIDAITTDEIRSMLEDAGKIYTQIKIDEITNTSAVKIRLRSLFAAMEKRK